MKVLILGGSGMLGHKVFQVLSPRFETYATFRNSDGLWKRLPMFRESDRTIQGVDALDFDSIVRAVRKVTPDVVVNCIGIVKQREESRDALLSISVNSLFPHKLAELCGTSGTRLIHISTDCVFSGGKGNYHEDDVPDPEDLYGRTKLLGELQRFGCLTIRTSLIGRDFVNRTGLLEWFLTNLGGRVRGFKNAIFTGFPTQVFGRILGNIIADHQELSGLYHVASAPITKYELLVRIRDAMKLGIEVEPFDGPRIDRSLNSARFLAATAYQMPSWDEMITELSEDKTAYDPWRSEHEVL